MTGEDKVWIWFGKMVAVCSFLFVLGCAALFVARALDADRSYMHDTTPLATPDTVRKVVKP